MDNVKKRFIIGTICVAILIVGLTTYLVFSNRKENEIELAELSDMNSTQTEEENTTDESETASTEMGKTVEESVNEVETEASLTHDNTTNTENSRVETESESKEMSSNIVSNEEVEKKEEKENPEFCLPIQGEIIREFASESLVYSNTLQEWITHNGIDIKADKTSVVSSAANGTVYAIKNDPRYGLTVIINHNGGYQTVYSNLLTAEFVVEGEKVEAGQTIGTVGNSASFEISDEYHLHFEILKDNKYIDPTTCIK